MADESPARAPAQPPRSWRASGLAALAVALLAGCANTESASRWIDSTLYGAAQGPPQVAYAGVDRVKVYSAPDASSPVQGVLTLHEQITRYQSESGFAYVEAEGNVAGWAREQQLVASRPRARKPTPRPAPSENPPAATEAPPSTTEPSAEPAPEEEPPPGPDEEPSEPEPSVFDPY